MVLEKPNYYTELDIVEHFNVSPQTVRRDAGTLRSMDILIHSGKKKFEITKFSDESLHNLINTYLVLNKHDSFKNLNLIKKRYRSSTLLTFVSILNASMTEKYSK